jgi:hypothetical protein
VKPEITSGLPKPFLNCRNFQKANSKYFMSPPKKRCFSMTIRDLKELTHVWKR